jgi:hypothetical protein
MDLRNLITSAVLIIAGCGIAGVAWAYTLSCNSSNDACLVKCDNGQSAGTMYWNGSQWSDGVRWGKDKNEVAKKMVAAQGSACR